MRTIAAKISRAFIAAYERTSTIIAAKFEKNDRAENLSDEEIAAKKLLHRHNLRLVHKRLIQALGSASAFLMFFILIGIGALAAARFYSPSPKGQAFIQSHINGAKLGEIGVLQIQGYKGDIFTKFSFEKFSISDEKGVWIDGNNLDIDWNPISLLVRKVHVTSAVARKVTIYRRPIIKKATRKLSISMEIDKIIAPIETKEEFSVKRGLWGSAFSLNIGRNHSIKVDGALMSAQRKGDSAFVHLILHEKRPFEANIEAHEANGGALSGMLGLNANLPLLLHAKIFASVKKGDVEILGKNGDLQFAKFNGGWTKEGGKIDGSANLNASHWSQFLAASFGQNANLAANWSEKQNTLLGAKSSLQNLNLEMTGNQSLLRLNGIVDFQERKANGPIKTQVKITNLGNLIRAKSVNLGNMEFDGYLTGALSELNLVGNYNIANIDNSHFALSRVSGDLKFEFADKKIDGEFGVNANAQNLGEIVGALFGNNPSAHIGLSIKDKDISFKEITLRGAAIKVDAKGGTGIFGNNQFAGSAEVGAPAVTKNGLNGLFKGNFIAHKSQGSMGFVFDVKAHGEGLKTKASVVNHFLGESPKLDGQVSISSNGLDFNSFKLWGNDIVFEGKGNGKPNPFADLTGKVNFGPKFLEIFEIDTSASGTFQFLGLGTKDGFKLKTDLNAKNFSTKIDFLNEYFTATPHIVGTLNLLPHLVIVENTNLISSKVKTNINGQLSGEGGFKLNGAWQMLTPFYLGDLEISGNPSGTGTIIGPHNGPIISVNSKLAQMNFQNFAIKSANLNATINTAIKPIYTDFTLIGATDFGPIQGKARLANIDDGMELSNINIQGAGVNALGSASFAKGKYPVADFNFAITKGLILRDGLLKGALKITKMGNEAYAKINANGQNFALQGQDLAFSNLALNGEGKFDNLTMATQFSTLGEFPINFSGKTNFKYNSLFSTIMVTGGGNMLGRNFVIQSPIEYVFSASKSKARGTLSINPSANQAGGMLDFDMDKAGTEFDANAKMRNFNLGIFQRDFAGDFSGQMQLKGRAGTLSGQLDGDMLGLRPKGLGVQMGLDGKIVAKLVDSKIQLDILAKNAQGLKIDANAVLPAVARVSPLRLAIDTQNAISGHAKINGEIRPLADLVFAGERSLSGIVDFETDLAGSIAKPELNGKIAISNGNYREPRIGLSLFNLALKGDIIKDKVLINQLYSKDKNGGELNANGVILLSQISGSNFNINAKKFRLVENDIARMDVSGSAKIEANEGQTGKMSGDFKIDYAEFLPRSLSANQVPKLDVIEINGKGQSPNSLLELQKPKSIEGFKIPAIALDVALHANNGVFIRGRGLNLELSINSRVSGTLAKPELSGLAKVYRGEYEYGGRSFEFADRGNITLATNPNNIRLNLEASRIANNITAKITIRGTAANPLIELNSVPDLPKDEILAQVLFGRARSQLSPLETVELATSLAALAGGGGFDVIGNLREIARLDRLVFANTASGQISIAGGKYISRQVYIELISEGTQGISTNVEWRPTQSTAIISKVGAQGDNKISIRWRHEIR